MFWQLYQEHPLLVLPDAEYTLHYTVETPGGMELLKNERNVIRRKGKTRKQKVLNQIIVLCKLYKQTRQNIEENFFHMVRNH